VVGGAAPVQVLPGEKMKLESVATGVQVALAATAEGNGLAQHPVVAEEAYWARVHLVSTSDEAFSDVSVALLLEDGKEIGFSLGQKEMASHAQVGAFRVLQAGSNSWEHAGSCALSRRPRLLVATNER
jgi:hypothetical protein